MTRCRGLRAPRWSSVIGDRSLVIGQWSSVVGHWSMVACDGYSPSSLLRMPMRFAAEMTLGRLARYLRLPGFDARGRVYWPGTHAERSRTWILALCAEAACRAAGEAGGDPGD